MIILERMSGFMRVCCDTEEDALKWWRVAKREEGQLSIAIKNWALLDAFVKMGAARVLGDDDFNPIPYEERGWKFSPAVDIGSKENRLNEHHIDLNRYNNKRSNIFMCTHSRHMEIHATLRRLIPSLLSVGILKFSDAGYELNEQVIAELDF